MKNRKVIIGITIAIAFIIMIGIGIGGVKVVNARKVNSSLELGIKYLEEGNYEEARLSFSKAISIDKKNDKATDLLELTENYMQLNELYSNKEYLLAADLISKIKSNNYLKYVEESINEISTNTEAKIVIINEINNLDTQIQQLISENKFQEAIDLINKYLSEDLKQEYLDKLNQLMNEVNESKTAYEQEQARLEEESKLTLEKLDKNEIIKLNKELTHLGDGFFESFNRENYDTNQLVRGIYSYIMKNSNVSNLIETEIINGKMYSTLTKEIIEEFAKKLFNIQIDHSKFVYNSIYGIEVINDKYAINASLNELLVDLNIANKVTKIDKNTYSIEFTKYTIDDYDYFEERNLVIEGNMINKCIVVGYGSVEVKQEIINNEEVYYFSNYQINYTN